MKYKGDKHLMNAFGNYPHQMENIAIQEIATTQRTTENTDPKTAQQHASLKSLGAGGQSVDSLNKAKVESARQLKKAPPASEILKKNSHRPRTQNFDNVVMNSHR